MLASLTPFEETRAYRELQEYKLEGKLSTLEELYQEGILTKEQFESRITPLKQQLEALSK